MNRKTLPRIDLHCHLDGSLPLLTMQRLLGRQIERSEVQASTDTQSLTEYLQKFEIPVQCLQTYENLKAAAFDFMEALQQDKIAYVEVRFAPLLSVHADLDCRRVIEAVLEGLRCGSERYGIDFAVIVIAMRHHGIAENLQMLKVAREFLGYGVGAADLAGDETKYPMHAFEEVFAQVRRWEMPFTIHAGETGNAENIRRAIACGAARIGHGIAMRGHEEIKALCRQQGIALEMCPVSNWQTKAVSRLQDYPLREFLEDGLMVTINTDNRTVSGTTIGTEMQFCTEQFGVTDAEILRMQRYAASAAFTTDAIKHKLCSLWEGNAL
ncbi:MAG: adenosine deaminase [Lachnospiraceae bacterium]